MGDSPSPLILSLGGARKTKEKGYRGPQAYLVYPVHSVCSVVRRGSIPSSCFATVTGDQGTVMTCLVLCGEEEHQATSRSSLFGLSGREEGLSSQFSLSGLSRRAASRQ